MYIKNIMKKVVGRIILILSIILIGYCIHDNSEARAVKKGNNSVATIVINSDNTICHLCGKDADIYCKYKSSFPSYECLTCHDKHSTYEKSKISNYLLAYIIMFFVGIFLSGYDGEYSPAPRTINLNSHGVLGFYDPDLEIKSDLNKLIGSLSFANEVAINSVKVKSWNPSRQAITDGFEIIISKYECSIIITKYELCLSGNNSFAKYAVNEYINDGHRSVEGYYAQCLDLITYWVLNGNIGLTPKEYLTNGDGQTENYLAQTFNSYVREIAAKGGYDLKRAEYPYDYL